MDKEDFLSRRYANCVTLTDAAIAHIKKQLESDERAIGLRFGVRGGGCAGYSYIMDPCYEKGEEDIKYEFNGLNVFVDKKSLQFVRGTKIHFNAGIRSHGITIDNPNVDVSCGCGSSITFR